MKKQNIIILSTILSISSVFTFNSTSLADEVGYKSQLSTAVEEYNEIKSNDPTSSMDDDIDINKSENQSSEKNISEELDTNLNKDENFINKENSNEKSKIDSSLDNNISNINNDNNTKNNNKPLDDNTLNNNTDEDQLNNIAKSDNEDLNDYNFKHKENELIEKNNNENVNINNSIKNKVSNNIMLFNVNTKFKSSDSLKTNDSFFIEKDSVYTYSNEKKVKATNVWFNIGKDKYFSNSKGKIVKGIQQIGLNRFYFANNGKLKTNTKIITNIGAYLIIDDGIMNPVINRWINVNSNKYHTGSSGKLDKGYKLIDKKIYFFDDFGQLEKNKTFLYNNSIITINTEGVVDKKRDTKVVIGDFEYKTDKNGKIISKVDLHKEPKVVSTYIKGNIGYKKYDNKKIEVAKNEWITSNGKKYRTDKKGSIMYGIHKIDGYYYNLTLEGLAKDYKVYIDNKLYDFDKTGKGKLISNNYKPKKDLDVAIGWMYQGMNFDYEYDMSWPNRDEIGYADCSSAVYRAMKHGGFISKDTPNGNTETLFDLGKRGKILKQISESQIRYGDIFVAGVPGQSLGAGGHTGFILDKNTIIHANWPDRGISVTTRKGRMGDNLFPVRYYRLVGGKSSKYNI